MNLPLKELNLRELPEYLVYNSRTGSNSAAEQDLVERLKDLPFNAHKFNIPLPETDREKQTARIKRLQQLAEKSRPVPKAETLIESSDAGKDDDIEPAAGQIWSVKRFLGSAHGLDVLPIARPQYIFLLTNPASLTEDGAPGSGFLRKYTDDRFVEFLPVSIHTEFANQYDVFFPPGNQILGVGFMVETQINSVCLVQDLDRCFGTVTEEEAEKILNTYFFAHQMGHDPDLYSATNTGTDTYPVDSVFNQYKEIEFENAQIVSEPVEKLRLRLENTRVIRIPYPVKVLAAAQEEINVAGETPDLTIPLHEDENLLLQINHYPKLGYYFVVNLASEFCNSEFAFSVEYFSDTPIKLERECPIPRKYHFAFYPEFKDGLYRISIAAGGKTLWAKEFVIEMEKR